jgi:hypothetical protein
LRAARRAALTSAARAQLARPQVPWALLAQTSTIPRLTAKTGLGRENGLC